MCGNAMIYNHPETIYYKAAKKLLHAGLKLVSEEKLRALAVTLPWMLQIPRDQLGFDLGTVNNAVKDSDKDEEEENVPPSPHHTPRPCPRRGPDYLPE